MNYNTDLPTHNFDLVSQFCSYNFYLVSENYDLLSYNFVLFFVKMGFHTFMLSSHTPTRIHAHQHVFIMVVKAIRV